MQAFSIGAVSFVQFLISPLDPFRRVPLVFLLSFLPCSHHELLHRLFIHLCSYLSHGSSQPVVAFGHQHFPSGLVTSSRVFCNSSALLIGTHFFLPFISESRNFVCPVLELSHLKSHFSNLSWFGEAVHCGLEEFRSLALVLHVFRLLNCLNQHFYCTKASLITRPLPP